jgi:hypothetical protein
MKEILRIFLDTSNDLHLIIGECLYTWIIYLILFIVVIIIIIKIVRHKKRYNTTIEIDCMEFGFKDNKIKIKPNHENIRIAYQLWVELNTRKIGLPLDFENDVIIEVYDSWYEFFKITRELVKEMPVQKIRNDKSSIDIIELAIYIMNEIMRPHLTSWQAKFRSWHSQFINEENFKYLTPQEMQKQFPNYDKLITDIKKINQQLIIYKDKLHVVSFGKESTKNKRTRNKK